MKVLIVEDEELAAEKLGLMIAAFNNEIEIVGYTDSIKSTVQWLQQNPQPEIILMDIELSDGQSFEIFQQVDIRSAVIFTTSYDEFAIRAFRVNSIDYLLKPILREDLKRAFEKYTKLKNDNSPVHPESTIDIQKLLSELRFQIQPKDYRQRFLVKQGQKYLPVEIDQIAFFFVDERLIFFKTYNNKRFIVDYTMDELETMLEPQKFFRINRSFIVSVPAIHQMHDYINSRLLLSLNPPIDEQVIVSRDKVAEFKKWIGK